MAKSSVVDTNVLIVASAADDGSPFRPEATPVQEAALRQTVLDWLMEFERDNSRNAVIDWDWRICDEYKKKLCEQDYGWLAIAGKIDRQEITWVGLDMDENGHALLPDTLIKHVTDLEDRKMVAAALAALADGHDCNLVNACDTDWLDCKGALASEAIVVHHLLEPWLQTKWKEKHPLKGKRRR